MSHLFERFSKKSSGVQQRHVCMYNELAKFRFDSRECRRFDPLTGADKDKKFPFSFSKTLVDFASLTSPKIEPSEASTSSAAVSAPPPPSSSPPRLIPLEVEQVDTVDVTNVSQAPRYFRVIPPPAKPICFDLSIDPIIMQLLPGETLAMTFKVKFHATSTIETEVPVFVAGVGFAPILVSARSASSTVIDADEVRTQSKAVHSSVNSKIYRASFRGDEVAVKVFGKHHGFETRHDLEKELNLWEGLNRGCPYIAKYFGCVAAPDIFAVVFEWSPCGSLREFIDTHGKALLEKNASVGHGIATDIAKAINYLHSSSVIHCNLASEHVLIHPPQISATGARYTAKLSDFGRARFVGDKRTKTVGRGMRPVFYVAPELMENEAYSRPSDIFSIALIMWEIGTLQRPYEGFEPSKIIRFVTEGARLPIPDTVTRQLAYLIERCWQQDPGNRPTSSELVTLLEASMPDSCTAPTPAQAPAEPVSAPVPASAEPAPAATETAPAGPPLASLIDIIGMTADSLRSSGGGDPSVPPKPATTETPTSLLLAAPPSK